MRYTLFNISNEETDQTKDTIPEEENEDVLTSESPIEKLESSFNKTADDTAKEIESFENCSNCEEELQEQVITIDEQLDTQPEEVTDDFVEVAQEEFYNSLSKVLTVEELETTKNKLSSEFNILPVEKLILTRESIMDVIKKIVEKIKQAFQQVGQFFKKLWTKFVVFMDGTAKRAGEVYKKYKDKQLNNIVPSKEQIDVIKEKIGLLVYAKGSIYASQLLPFIKYNITPLNKVSDNNQYKSLGVNSATSKILRIFQNPDLNMTFNLIELVTNEYKDKKELSKPVQIISVIESEIKAVFFQLGKDDSGNYTDKKYEDCLYETVTVNKDINVPNNIDTKKIVDDLKIIELYAKGASSYKDRLLEVQSSSRKALDEIAKQKTNESYDKTQLKFIQILGTKMILDNIMQYVKNCKNMLYVSETILKSLDDISNECFSISNENILDIFKKKIPVRLTDKQFEKTLDKYYIFCHIFNGNERSRYYDYIKYIFDTDIKGEIIQSYNDERWKNLKKPPYLDISKKLTNRYSQLGIKGENLWFPRLMFGDHQSYLHEFPKNDDELVLQTMVFNTDVDYLKDVYKITPATKTGQTISTTDNLKLPDDIKTKLNYVKSNIKKFCYYKNNDKFVSLVYYYYDKAEKNNPPFDVDEIDYSPTFNIVQDFVSGDGDSNVADREGFRGLNLRYIDLILKDLEFIEKTYLK